MTNLINGLINIAVLQNVVTTNQENSFHLCNGLKALLYSGFIYHLM